MISGAQNLLRGTNNNEIMRERERKRERERWSIILQFHEEMP
jgi:hypothetical protein